MRLEKIGFANYRSIGNTYAYIDLTKRINLLIGPNNAGKSNIISALELIKNTIKPITEELKLNPEDIHKVNTDNFVVCFVVMINSNRLYVPINYKNGRIYENEDYIIEAISQDMPRIPQMELYESVFNILQMELPKIIKIPPIREIKHGDGSKYTPDGKGIIEILADWKSPEKNEDYKREKFEKIQSFLRVLLNDGRIEIDVPTKQPEILIKAGYQRLPLSHFGTGVHELIILAITLLSYKNTLICLEEPEIHLHPLLQKKLLNFLLEKTTNNYLITTHSNSMLIFDDRVSITRVYKENDATIAKSVTETKEILPLLNDLGCCASDIIQANSVIWVEGPSDRTYINKWIS
ncbi:MAG: AAA family ATPase, partial [Endomicrobium sp.]|nr:AAA family ATPase [Endomicrobium sp.]